VNNYNKNKQHLDDNKQLMMSGDFNARLWLLRLAILAINIILIAILFGTARAASAVLISGPNDTYANMLIPIIGIIQTIAAFVISFMKFKGSKIIAIILAITGTITFMLKLAGIIG
jgi:hypothetical protein